MASVVVCPHCYLQLLVPDGIEHDAHVECPACRDEFDLAEASPRALPEIVRAEPSPYSTTTSKVLVSHDPPRTADDLAAAGDTQPDEFATREIVPHIPEPNADETDPRESLTVVHDDGEAEQADAQLPELEIEPVEPPSKSSAVTLADLQSPTVEQSGDEDDAFATVASGAADESQPESLESNEPTIALPGPTFELPDIPLSKKFGATVDPGSDSPSASAASTDFELDDVEFDVANPKSDDRKTVPESTDVTVEIGEGSLPSSDQLKWSTQPTTTSQQPNVPTSFEDSPTELTNAEFEANVAPVIAPLVGRPRRRSVVRTLVGFFIFSLGGLVGGYYILLYLLGPRGDVLDVAQYLPTATLPASFRPAPTQLAESTESEATQIDAATAAADTPKVVEESDYGADLVGRSEPTTGSYGVEPARFETEVTTPLPADLPRVSGGPSYTVDDLASALVVAQAALPGFVAGDLLDPSVRQAKGHSYAKLCELAQVLTFCDDTSTAQVARLEREAKELFRTTLADAHTRGEVVLIAKYWIESPNRQHGGVFLAGNISGGEIAGDVYEYRLQAEDGTTHVILLPESLDNLLDSAATMLGIVGTIIDRPREKIAGYTGDAQQVLWVRSAMSLE